MVKDIPPLFFQISRSHAHFKIVGKVGLRDLTLNNFLISFIKNVNSFTSNKITPSSFRESKKILPSTFIYESNLIFYINANNIQTQLFIKNVGSSIFYKKSTGLCDWGISVKFIYESFFIKFIWMPTLCSHKVFYLIKYGLKGHYRSQRVLFMFKNPLFIGYLHSSSKIWSYQNSLWMMPL